MIQISFRKVRPLVIGNFRFVLLLSMLVWLGVCSVSPALASNSPDMPFPPASLDYCPDDPSFRTDPSSNRSLLLPDDCFLPDLISPPEAPRLLLPDLRTLPPYDLEIITLPDGSRELRLSNTIWNSGVGPLELEGVPNPAAQKTRVEQHVYAEDGAEFDLQVGDYIWHVTHDHFHFEDFSIYELWILSPSGKLERLVSTSGKLSYCVIDTDITDRETVGFSPFKRYGGCGNTLQGLSVGWGDTYKSHLDGQSIPLPKIADGFYALKSTVNPDAILLEANFRNNTALIFLEICGAHVELIDFADYLEQRCQESDSWMVPGLLCSY